MNNRAFMQILSLPVICALITGCASSEENQSCSVSREDRIVHTISANADFAEFAYTLDELKNASDFIAEVKIVETEAFLKDEQSVIFTEMTPEVIKIYKGEYNGESLVMGGGYMDCLQYADAEFFRAADINMEYTDEELENGLVYYDWCNNYVPEVGDNLIFFGVLDDDGNYAVTYSYQGIFLCEGENVSCQALSVERDGWTEPLAEDLFDKFGSEDVSMQSRTTGSGLIISKNALTEALD